MASDKQEYAARTIRGKIHRKMGEFLTEFPPVEKHPYEANVDLQAPEIDWKSAKDTLQVDRTVPEVDWCVPGTCAGLEVLEEFVQNRLRWFADKRNDPCQPVLSNLSPYFHFGQVAPQRSILRVQAAVRENSSLRAGADVFIEENVIRRELSENFCYYQLHYDSIDCASDWAKNTLRDHTSDPREYVYTLENFERAETHDDLWNAAQLQMVSEGKMHGFLRMYWAKKILEWTETPEQALQFAIYLNDR